MSGYDANKAAVFNKLRQQGLTESQAAAQAGLSDSDFGNYSMGVNGQLGPMDSGSSKKAGVDYERYSPQEESESARFNAGLSSSANFEQVDYAQTPRSQPTSIKPVTYTTTSTETVSGGGSTTIVAGPRQATAESQAIGAAYTAKNAEYNQFLKDNPSDFARKKQGLPPLTPEEKQQRQETLDRLNLEKEQLKNQQIDAETPGTPSVTTVPNTTTTTQTVSTFTTPTNAPVNIANDEAISQQAETQLDNETPTVSTAGNSTSNPAPVSTAEDPFEAQRLEAEERFNQEPAAFTAEDVGEEDPEVAFYQEQQQANARAELAAENFQPEPVPPSQTGYTGVAYDDDGNLLPGYTVDENNNPVFVGGGFVEPATAASAEASRTQALKLNAQDQQTRSNQASLPSSADWRVRLSLAPSATYLYQDPAGPGILAPLARTGGVIFPYTPQIETSYQAKYETVDLTHSNYKGYFYKNSAVESVNVRATFTAQDTREAQYLLAVIHFFRSVTKMFYGANDKLAGTPPPLVFLSGLGQYQFNKNPCVVSSFTYSLPNDVDYIRADGFNNYGINLDNRRNQSSGPPATGVLGAIATVNRLLNNGLVKRNDQNNAVNQNNSNTNYTNSTYVPTKMEISISLLPVQTRSQVSTQFSMQKFANGSLLKGGGFW